MFGSKFRKHEPSQHRGSTGRRSEHDQGRPIPPGKVALLAGVLILAPAGVATMRALAGTTRPSLSQAFPRRILAAVSTEAPHEHRFFSTAVKTDSRGQIVTGPTSDPVKNIVGAEPAGERGGLPRYNKIMFGADYFDGRPDPGTRIDPNNPVVNSGSEFWPFRPQPFRSWPNALAVTPDGGSLYVT